MKKFVQKGAERGFTLIELMIVVAIIGILAAVAIPKFAEMIRKSKEGATKGSMTALRSASTIYVSDNEGKPPSSFDELSAAAVVFSMVPKYIEAIPTSKLGTYHPDANAVVMVGSTAPNHDDRDFKSRALTLPNGQASLATLITWAAGAQVVGTADSQGWLYSSHHEGTWWVNCSHTDTKNTGITLW